MQPYFKSDTNKMRKWQGKGASDFGWTKTEFDLTSAFKEDQKCILDC